MSNHFGPRKKADPRHSAIKALLDSYWQRENPMIPSLPWGPADAGALGMFLTANPNLSPDVVATCLEFRLVSLDHAPGERVYRWIGDVLRYAGGPLNQFKQPTYTGPAPEAAVGTWRPDRVRNEPEPQETAREFMGEEWFERACKQAKDDPSKLTEIQRRCLRDEGLL
jgi:hypothetical protein